MSALSGKAVRRRPILETSLVAPLLLFGFVVSIIQPRNRLPDEGAHAQYVRFLATEQRLPLWVREGGGEAGYEAQHPPLYYGLGSVVYALASGLDARWGRRAARLLAVAAGAAAICGWWYVRSINLYGSPFVHTTARVGPGFALADQTGNGGFLLWFTLRETYLSTWAQRGWLTPGSPEILLYVLLSGLLLAAAVAGGIGLARRKDAAPTDPAPWLCALFMATLIAGHQFQVWFVDYEFNAGGRYLLNVLMGAHALVIAGLGRMPRAAQARAAWVAVFVLMDIVSVSRVATVLNPKYAPGWRIFHFPPGEEPSALLSPGLPEPAVSPGRRRQAPVPPTANPGTMRLTRWHLIPALLLAGCARQAATAPTPPHPAAETRPSPPAPDLLAPIPNPRTPAEKIVNAAKAEARRGVRYDARYVRIPYPGGDVPPDRGACTDVVIRSLRAAGCDLQRLIHEDIRRAPRSYRRREDASIDHRRVPNQIAFLRRYGLALPTSVNGAAAASWQPGDLVYWHLPGGIDHCGVLSNVRNARGLPLVIHNLSIAVQEDCLTAFEITDHFRYPVQGRRRPGGR